MGSVRDHDGFTLVELMVVVMLIGILVMIAVPVFNSAEKLAQRNSCWSNERTIEGAYQAWQAQDVGATRPTDWAELMTDLDGGYLRSTPACPTGGTYSASFSASGTSVTISCAKHATHD